MPLRRGAPLTFTGRGLSDSIDATNSAKGAMRSLVNLVPNPTTRGTWVCRPGQVGITTFLGFDNPGFVSGREPVGNIEYGMIASDLNPGFDQPYAYDLANDVFLTVSGIIAANVPASPPATGDWTPPVLARVGSRVVVTHPGFPGGDFKFGWFDVSGFEVVVEVDFESGKPFLFGGFSLLGIQPGMAITGAVDIPAGATVKNIFPNTQSVLDFIATSDGTADLVVADSSLIFTEMWPGKTIAGPGIQDPTVIVTRGGSIVTLSRPTLTSETGTFRAIGNVPSVRPYTYEGDFTLGDATVLNVDPVADLHTGQLLSGVNILPSPPTYVKFVTGTTMEMTQEAIGTAANAAFSAAGVVVEMTINATADGTGPVKIAGGTETAPQWGAGDTAINPLPSVPLGVAQMNGRAWFADGPDGIPFSDSLLACVRTNGTQALTVNNSQPVTAIGPLMLSAPLTGGIVQSLVAFQADVSMQQIVGDPATANLTMNLLSVPTGTHAPNTITPTAMGLAFVSPEGLRIIGFDAKVSDPIGQDGDGVVLPFLRVNNPPLAGSAFASRMTAAASGRTLRIDTPLTDGTTASYWYDLTRRIWTGPHTGAASLVKTWTDTFLITPADGSAVLLRADDSQQPDSLYVENGLPMQWEWESSLLPDSGEMAENTIIESAFMVALPPGQQVQVNFLNETRVNLDGVAIAGLQIEASLSSPWGGPIYTGPDTGVIRQRQVPWTVPLIFKQGSVNVRGNSDPGIVVGNFYMRYQILGYLLEVPQIPAATPTDLSFLLANDGVTILRNNGPVNLRPI